ncbi:MAG: type II toxin-antitoxin system RelE/ParE family toxin [Melioribacteraceae bacterium]|nr:type II toxin-antitoxin system RelE/ParE family toxin [Melioribacteraceae bacterium]
MKNRIEFKSTAIKDLERIESKYALNIMKKIKLMEEGLVGDVKRLTNFTPEYRLRIGKFRVLFEFSADKIIIYRIKHRKELYR